MTKILLDSSAWIHFLRKKPGWFQFVADLLEKDSVVISGLVVTEILRGARTAKDRDLLRRHLEVLDFLDLKEEDYYESAELGSLLLTKGFTVKSMDLLIAQTAISHRTFLLQDDSDFLFIARHAPLKLLDYRS